MARLLPWYGFLGAAAAWSLQLVAAYGIEDAACPRGGSEPWLVAVTLAAGALALGSIGAAYRGLRAPDGSIHFLGAAGLAAGLFFLVLIGLGGLQLVSLDPCRQG
jgi:hypothetical protein